MSRVLTALVVLGLALLLQFGFILTKRLDTIDARFDAVDARFDAVDARFGAMHADISGIRADVTELLGSAHTLGSAERLDACARRFVWLLDFVKENGKWGSCSAFAYAREPAAAAVLVTAAHCFASVNATARASLRLRRLDDASVHTCSLAKEFEPKQDAAVLFCPTLALGAGLAPAVAAPRLAAPVALAGFAVDAFSSMTARHFPSSTAALNVDFVRTVGVSGPPLKPDGAACTAEEAAAQWPVTPLGYVDRRVTPGMSGGAVLDKECGVVGIAHGRSCGAGVFVALAPVDAFLAGAAVGRRA